MATTKKPAAPDDADKKEQDDYLEEALEETFPASDPISPGRVHTEKPPAGQPDKK